MQIPKPIWKPFLRKRFFVRRGYRGWDVCWLQYSPVYGWGLCAGLRRPSLRDAKAIRRFLNSRVARGMNYGLPFAEVVRFVRCGSVNPDDPKAFF